MRLSIFFIAALSWLSAASLRAQQWAREYQSSIDFSETSVHRLADGRFLFAAVEIEPDANGFYLWSTDSFGSNSLARLHSAEERLWISDIETLASGDRLLVGSIGDHPGFFVIGENGTTRKSRKVTSGLEGYLERVVARPTGGFLAIGTGKRPEEDDDMLLVWIDADGELETWSRYGDYFEDDEGHDVIVCRDGSIALAGLTEAWGAGSMDLWVLKLDPEGYPLWEKSYGTVQFDQADGGRTRIAESPTGDLFLTGGQQFWAIKLDSHGNVLWDDQLIHESFQYPVGIAATSDGGVAIFGGYMTANPQDAQMCLVRLDTHGDIVWQRAYGDPDHLEFATALEQTPEGDFVLLGRRFVVEDVRAVAYRVGPNGLLDSPCPEVHAKGPASPASFVVSVEDTQTILSEVFFDEPGPVLSHITTEMSGAASCATNFGPWIDLGHELPGAGGAAYYAGSGATYPESLVDLVCNGGTPNTDFVLVIGNGRIDRPLAGGLLVPSANLYVGEYRTRSEGEFQIYALLPFHLPVGNRFYSQLVFFDPTGPYGLTMSNAIEMVAQ